MSGQVRETLSAAELVQLGSGTQPWVQGGVGPVILDRAAARGLPFAHLKTYVSYVAARAGRDPNMALGSTVWVSVPACTGTVVLAFNWAMVAPGVLCVNNPLSVSSNLFLADAATGFERNTERLVLLMDLVHSLRWEDKVREHLPVDLGYEATEGHDRESRPSQRRARAAA